MNTDRRAFFGASAALALPACMARAFGEDPEPPARSLAAAREHARARGKPLLVILTDSLDARIEVGRIWGHLFANADEETWLDLALVEVACFESAMFSNERPAAGTWAVVIDTDGIEPRTRGVIGALPPVPAPHEWSPETARARAAALSALVRAAILPDEAARERRRAQVAATLPPDMMHPEHGRFAEALIHPESARLVDLDRYAALLRFGHEFDARARLAAAARMRLFELDPSGARWDMTSAWCPPCGMGFVPPESRYFLRFYTA